MTSQDLLSTSDTSIKKVYFDGALCNDIDFKNKLSRQIFTKLKKFPTILGIL